MILVTSLLISFIKGVKGALVHIVDKNAIKASHKWLFLYQKLEQFDCCINGVKGDFNLCVKSMFGCTHFSYLFAAFS